MGGLSFQNARRPCGLEAPATSLSLQEATGEEKNLFTNSQNVTLRVCQEDLLSDGVYHHAKILSLVGWLKVYLLYVDDRPQVSA